MPDSEMVKILLQAGMFGLWLILTLWVLFYGAPMMERLFKKFSEDSATAAEKVAMEHKLAMEVVVEAARQETEECRKERREQAKMYASDREADRISRHDAFKQTLTNSGTAAALRTSSTALRRVADLTGEEPDRKMAEIAEKTLEEHEVAQAEVAKVKVDRIEPIPPK